MNNYYELQIKINPALEEVISEIFFENLPCEGVVLAEETYKDLEMISTTQGTLKVFLTSEPENLSQFLKDKRELLKARGLTDEELGSWDYVISDKPNEDWSKKWKEKWDITRVTDKIVIVPDWLEYNEKGGEVVIRLEPGCAFGTGTHQTTQLCMKAIEKYMPINAKAADIGMGSGILAICAKKFGASEVYGCDNDETVIDVAKENALKNNVECIFELNTADKITKTYDFICANILHNVLAEIMGDLKNIMNDGAILVLSGILDEKKPVVSDAIKKYNLELIEEAHQDQWVALIVRKVD
ncbi:ribosomal protein L11 methyltransferase [Clostridium sp. CAG:967]|nr:ribosomal protein L11 methyltransferase [Clostridium sp. CAG:967]